MYNLWAETAVCMQISFIPKFIVDENLIVAPKCKIIFGTLLICTFLQYCYSNIKRFFIVFVVVARLRFFHHRL